MTGETALAAGARGMLAAVAHRGARLGTGTTPGVPPGPARCPRPLVHPAVSASTWSDISGARARRLAHPAISASTWSGISGPRA